MKQKLSKSLSLLLTLCMLPTVAFAAGEEKFEDFFTELTTNDIATVTNSADYPYVVDITDSAPAGGPWLKSTNFDKNSTSPTITITFTKAAALSFDWKVSSESNWDGMMVKRISGTSTVTLYTLKTSGSGMVTSCSGTANGAATVQAETGDIVSISYEKDSGGKGGDDTLWLKNFTYTEPAKITFHANYDGAESATYTQSAFEENVTLKANSFTRDNYVFKGWATTENGEVSYLNKAPITVTEDTNLYAVWAPLYTLDFAVTPANATFGLYEDNAYNKSIAAIGQTTYSYSLEAGTYYWKASAFGYADNSGSVTLSNAAVNETVSLTPNANQTFMFQYSGESSNVINGNIKVVTGTNEISAQSESNKMVFDLPLGYIYTYTFTSSNFTRQTGAIDLTSGELSSGEITIPLTVKTAWEGADDIETVTPEDGVYTIRNGAQLAWFAQQVNNGSLSSANAVLDVDIDLGNENWTPIGVSSDNYQYKGTFDGMGHTISNLKVVGSSYLGLFGYNTGTITGMTVEGEVNGTGTYVGGLVGYNKGTISKCVNKATVTTTGSNTSASTGLVGGITAYSDSNTQILNCANYGTIIATNGVGAGGIVGNAYGGYGAKAIIKNVYNTGNITAYNWSGGIIGVSNYADLQNAYNRGAIAISGPSTYVGELIGNINYSTGISGSNLFYVAGGKSPAGYGTITAISIADKDAMEAALAGQIGAFIADTTPNINGGWPILGFQDPTATYNFVFTVSPANATVILTKDSNNVTNPSPMTADGKSVYIFEGLNGVYSYTAELDDHVTQTGTINISGENESRQVNLVANTYSLAVTVDPADATVVLKESDGTTVTNPTPAGGVYSYTLPSGSYDLTVSKFAYLAQTDTLVINKANSSKTVTLATAASTKATFAITYSDSPSPAPAATIVVKYGGMLINAEPDGSYTLPSGEYIYTVKAKGYAAIKNGTISIPEIPETTTSIPVTMEPSAAWDGTEIEEPAEGNGTTAAPYLIENGAQLKWYANRVNSSSSYSGICAKLTADIDLGDNPWEPIGKSSSYKFAGTFDGGGYTIKGLNIDITSTGYVGLFGYVNGSNGTTGLALIKNLTVEGKVVGGSAYSGYVGAIVGYAYNCGIENCHNKASVSNTLGAPGIGGVVGYLYNGGYIKNSSNHGAVTAENSENVGGLAGWTNVYSSNATVTQSYNSGTVVGKAKVGGVLGNLASEVQDVYNTGSVRGTEAVGGIAGYQGAKITNAYTTGAVSGTTDVFAAFGRVSSTYTKTNIFYLNTLTADTNATAKSPAELRALYTTLGGNWKDNTEGSTNNQYPLLSWQDVVEPEPEPGEPLEEPVVSWQKENAESETSLILPIAEWETVDDAVSYELHLVVLKAEGGYKKVASVLVPAVENQTDYLYDFAAAFEAGKLGENDISNGRYYLQIVAKPAAETAELADSLLTKVSADYYSHIHLSGAAGLKWVGVNATWDAVEYAEFYSVTVYRLPAADGGDLQYVYSDSVEEGTSLDCTGLFSPGGRYVFQLLAFSQECLDGLLPHDFYDEDGAYAGYSELDYWLECGYASAAISNADGNTNGVYSPDPAPDKPTEWINITTAQQLVDLANVENKMSADGKTNEQAIAWSKNYRLANDIDYSTLPASYSNKTNTIGNLNYQFTGYFDGNGYEITGLTLSNRDSGIFAYIGATGVVDGVKIRNANVLFSDNAGVLAYANNGVIKNCAVLNTNITADVGAVLGGMLSRNYGIVEDSYVLGGTLKSNTEYATGHAGFVGSNEAGGIIRRCYTTMEIDTQSKYAGGFVGLCYGGEISNCFALGNVTAREHSGGFAGSVVFPGNSFNNCYASNAVTVDVAGSAYGFVSIRTPESAFAGNLEKDKANFKNCLYNADLTATDESPALVTSKTTEELKAAAILTTLGTENWNQDADKNSGLPYLKTVPAPTGIEPTEITVEIMMAIYNKNTYGFVKQGEPISVTMNSNGNTRVIDVMDAAMAQEKLAYSYNTSTEYGRYIQSINDYAVNAPNGWMFTVNDSLSNLSASIASVEDGAKILWYEGTTENRFASPTWDEILTGRPITWIDIGTAQKLIDLTYAEADLTKNYRLTAQIDLTDLANFYGIGDDSNPFTGMFDGQGHTISGLSISAMDRDNIGLFGVIEGAVIKNIILDAPAVAGKDNVGALVGLSKATLAPDDPSQSKASLIGNCHVVGGTVAGSKNVGGLAGQNAGKYDSDTGFSKYSAINQSSSSAAVTVSGSGSGVFGAGGLVGKNEGYITDSNAEGGISANRGVGGFVGENTGEIYDSHASGNVVGVGYVGGFAGLSTGKVKHCYSLGNVRGQEYTGGFAGSLSAAEQLISCGQVTIVPGSLSGYNGNLTGQLHGSLAGVENMITVKNVYANCVTKDAGPSNIIGNLSEHTGETNVAVLEAMQLTTWTDVADKLYQLFGVNLPVTSLEDEADKYVDVVSLAADMETGAAINLLKAGVTVDSGITVAFDIKGSEWLTADGSTLKLKAQNNTVGAVTIHVQIILSNADGSYRKDIKIVLLPDAGQTGNLMNRIAAGYMDKSNEWIVFDMAAYKALFPSTDVVTSADALQNYINYAIGTVADYTKGTATAGRTYAKAEMILRSIGGDTTKLYPANSNTPISNPSKLKAMNIVGFDVFDAPWILLANLQGNIKLSGTDVNTLIKTIKDAQPANGIYSYSWGGVTYADPDTTANAITALAAYYSTNADARSVIDKAIAGLSDLQGANGSFGDPNSDAMIIIALVSMGIDPETDSRFMKNGISLVNGLLSYANDALDGFLYYGTENALATEQSFRALIAAAQFQKTGAAINIYDFNAKKTEALRATGESSDTKPSDPTGSGKIHITFSLKSDTAYWIENQPIEITEGSTVYHAFVKALKDGFTHVGAGAGYVRSITNTRTGVKLGEFDKGQNSGWLYKVNGEQPKVGLTYYVLKDGDVVEWFYSTDYTRDDGSGSWSGGGNAGDQEAANSIIAIIDVIGTVTKDSGDAIKEARRAYNKLTDAQKVLVTNYDKLVAAEKAYSELMGGTPLPFVDVREDDWYYDAVQYAFKNGLFEGVSDDEFDPAGEMTRAMLMTVLYRYEGKPAVSGKNLFVHVVSGTWYTDAVIWAVENGIIRGYGDGIFGTDDPVSREQIAVILLNYAKYKETASNNENDLKNYIDSNEISGWALDAMKWANAEGLITGRGSSTLEPIGTANRAEVATILMRYIEDVMRQA
jgi:uncharacterized repeat protein (TIGR02543 family)